MQVHKFFLKKILGGIVVFFVLIYTFVYSADLTSTSFIIKDPIVGSGGGFGSSTSFASYFSGDLTMISAGSSASFEGRYGFLWYPYVIPGVFSALANASDADLSWSASTAGLGWNVSGYNTGIASVSGGPYSYTSVGLVTNYSYTNLAPGHYCFILQTLDGLGNVIATSQEECIDISPIISFSISNNSIDFGALSSSGPRYADISGGSNSNTVAHTMSASSNAPSGYTISYIASTLTSGANTITPATITNSSSGTPGTKQFALSLSSSGGATISSGYNQNSGSGNWKFVANTLEDIASTSGFSSTETFSNRFISNIDSGTPAGNYSTNITYVITGNF